MQKYLVFTSYERFAALLEQFGIIEILWHAKMEEMEVCREATESSARFIV